MSPIVLRRELIDEGVPHRAILQMLSSGALERVRHGAYVDGATWRASDEMTRHRLRARAVLRQARTPVTLSHLSALAEWDVALWDVDLTTVDLTRLDRRAGRHEAGVRQHHGRLPADEVVHLNGIAVTTAARAAVESLQVLDVERGLVAVNDILHRRLATAEQLGQVRQRMDHWPHSLTADLVLRLAEPACESAGESRVLFVCWKQRLPFPTAQYAVYDRFGRFLGRVDFAWPEHRLFLEFDGKVKYEGLLRPGESASDVVVREKRREERIVEAMGWRCMRVTWSDLSHPERLAGRIRSLIAAQAS
ncbi:type IV toxin-antitoxin system AbiEi family antitoxin domain-containing protein [Nocardioides flavescens]|uniref:AbiEi antitoxin N-terminal domain-containing protein n=1 Tax=Nocardioides flavescens TaxID=2691959 RepID=A0A6L7EWF4_9ACTN|nr:type IV toxin-antitoxin system AbiEi family antitoxin domain-containing protein [Nocardioides flavescens]MXG88525.1 hypothetical protein [Nocardioides flavescens]